MKIIDGKALAASEEKELAKIIIQNQVKPCLVILSCDPDNASAVYLKNKEKAAKRIGIDCRIQRYEPSITTDFLLEEIEILNNDKNISGIIVQLPLPKHLDVSRIQNKISPYKDVDGFHPQSKFTPCTPAACLRLIKSQNLNVEGKHCVVIGRSEIVGKPLARLLLDLNATVTQCHSRTSPVLLEELCSRADFIFSAAGKANLIQPSFIKEGCVLIDISINRKEEGKLCGDAAEGCAEKCSFFTPVPGGVGPMTVNTLMYHTVFAALRW